MAEIDIKKHVGRGAVVPIEIGCGWKHGMGFYIVNKVRDGKWGWPGVGCESGG